MKKVLWIALLLVGLALWPSGVRAEVAYVHSGANYGQGWVFSHPTGCWLVTAGHVVSDPTDGVVVLSGRSTVWTGYARRETITINRDDDLAVMQLEGSLASHCPASDLGNEDEGPLLARAIGDKSQVFVERRKGGSDETALRRGLEEIPLFVRGAAQSMAFTVRPQNEAHEAFHNSDSGSPVLLRGAGISDDALPLGIVTSISTDSSLVKVVRMDAIRRFFESYAASRVVSAMAGNSSFTILDAIGNPHDARCGVDNINRTAAACGWKVWRKGSRISIILAINGGPFQTAAIDIRFGQGGVPRSVELETAALIEGEDQWEGDRKYSVTEGAMGVTCPVGLRLISYLRIRFDTPYVEVVSIKLFAP